MAIRVQISGPAGCGKSMLLRRLLSLLPQCGYRVTGHDGQNEEIAFPPTPDRGKPWSDVAIVIEQDPVQGDASPVGMFLREVSAEVARARSKFPSSRCSVIALMEEVGELAKAVLDEPRDRIVAEAVQVACMAVRVALEGDPSVTDYRRARADRARADRQRSAVAADVDERTPTEERSGLYQGSGPAACWDDRAGG